MKIDQIHNKNQKLFESRLREDVTYRSFYQVGRVLIERRMTNDEIQKLFKDVETNFSATKQNRTMVGRGVDVATDIGSYVANAYRGVADRISKSGPVSAFDVGVDKLMDRIKSGAGGDSGSVMKAIQKYRQFAKTYPVAQGAVYAGLLALAGLSGAGLGGAALLAGVKTFDKMLLGNKASSALWSGFLTGASAYTLSQLAQAWANSSGTATGGTTTGGTTSGYPVDNYGLVNPIGPEAGAGTGGGAGTTGTTGTGVASTADVGEVPGTTSISGDLPTLKAQPGDTLSQIAQKNNISVKDLQLANPEITDVHKILTGQEIKIPAPTGNPVYQDGIGTGGPRPTAPGPGVQTPNPVAVNPAEPVFQAPNPVAVNPPAEINPRGFVYDPVTGEMVPGNSEIAQAIRSGERVAAKETRTSPVKIKRMPMREMVDHKATIWSWQLQESLHSRHERSLQLTDRGVRYLFKVVEAHAPVTIRDLNEYRIDPKRVQKTGQKISQKLASQPVTVADDPTAEPASAPAAAEPPEYLRPSRPGAPVAQPEKPGIMSRIGQGFRDFGRQLTTTVTAEKLNTNWKVAGSPTDSDKLFDFLQQQGVPAEVATSVYQQLNLPVPGAADAATTDAAGTAGTSQPTKLKANDIVAQLKAVWEPIINNQENPIGDGRVKNYIKDMFMRAGGLKATAESRRRSDPMIRKAISEVRERQRLQQARSR